MSSEIVDNLRTSLLALRQDPPTLTPNRRILVVDDDQAYSHIIGETLRELGYEVDFASEGSEAVKLVARTRPYVTVFLDLFYPVGPSGAEILRAFRSLLPNLPVVIITGYPDPDLDKLAESIGCQILHKPANADDLRRAIEQNQKA